MSSIGLPLQGFFNFLIFIRPRYITSRRRHPNNTRVGTLLQAIWWPMGQKDHQDRSPCLFCERLGHIFSRTNLGNIVDKQNGEKSAHGDTNAAFQERGKDIRDMNPSNKNRSMLASLSPVEDVEVDNDGDNNKTVVKGIMATNGRAKKDFFWESGHFDAETRLEANDDVDNKNDAWIMFR
jgi:hypothetical protein